METISTHGEASDLGTAIAEDAAKMDIHAHKDGDDWLPLDWFDSPSTRAFAKCAFYGRLEVLREAQDDGLINYIADDILSRAITTNH